MSVSSINPANPQTYQASGNGSPGTSSTSVTSGVAETSNSVAAAMSAEMPVTSTTVTLSAGAQVLASFAAAGITFGEVSVSSLGGSPGAFANASPAQQFAMLQSAASATAPHSGGGVTQAAFEKLVDQFGGTKAQADQLFEGLDTNGNGSISNEEFLNGLANTAKDGSSPVSQMLLGLMNTDRSGSVSFSQFGQFETAFVQAENQRT